MPIRKIFNNDEERKLDKKAYLKEYRKNNQETAKTTHKKYYKNHKVELKSKAKEFRKNNREKIQITENNRLKIDINFKLRKNLRIRIYQALKGNAKSGSAVKDLGCTIPELKLYLENKFKEGMSWDNWNRTGWHIDHIIPLDSFNLQNREEFLKACHYTNLQPMWAEDNLTKSSTRPIFFK